MHELDLMDLEDLASRPNLSMAYLVERSLTLTIINRVVRPVKVDANDSDPLGPRGKPERLIYQPVGIAT